MIKFFIEYRTSSEKTLLDKNIFLYIKKEDIVSLYFYNNDEKFCLSLKDTTRCYGSVNDNKFLNTLI